MGSSIKIQDTNLDITKFKCSQCQQPFTKQDKEKDNWDLWFDTFSHVKLEKTKEGYSAYGDCYELRIGVQDITHRSNRWGSCDCPETAICPGCCGRFLNETMSEFKGEFYCSSCYKEVNNE